VEVWRERGDELRQRRLGDVLPAEEEAHVGRGNDGLVHELTSARKIVRARRQQPVAVDGGQERQVRVDLVDEQTEQLAQAGDAGAIARGERLQAEQQELRVQIGERQRRILGRRGHRREEDGGVRLQDGRVPN
jgi:hypothetical protein